MKQEMERSAAENNTKKHLQKISHFQIRNFAKLYRLDRLDLNCDISLPNFPKLTKGRIQDKERPKSEVISKLLPKKEQEQ